MLNYGGLSVSLKIYILNKLKIFYLFLKLNKHKFTYTYLYSIFKVTKNKKILKI